MTGTKLILDLWKDIEFCIKKINKFLSYQNALILLTLSAVSSDTCCPKGNASFITVSVFKSSCHLMKTRSPCSSDSVCDCFSFCDNAIKKISIDQRSNKTKLKLKLSFIFMPLSFRKMRRNLSNAILSGFNLSVVAGPGATKMITDVSLRYLT